MNKIKAEHAIIFDCDGTLISSIEGILKAIQQVMSEVLNKEFSMDYVRSNYTADMVQIAKNFGIDTSDQILVNKLMDTWNKAMALESYNYDLFPGVLKMIKGLFEQGHAVFVWTARDRASTKTILKNLGVLPYIWDLRCYDDCTPKPHPQGVIELASTFEKSKTIVIGDSMSDILGAKSYGCSSIAALWCHHSNRTTMEEMSPEFMADTVEKCYEQLQEFIKK